MVKKQFVRYPVAIEKEKYDYLRELSKMPFQVLVRLLLDEYENKTKIRCPGCNGTGYVEKGQFLATNK